MDRKQQTKYGIIAGTIMLVLVLALAMLFGKPTLFQRDIIWVVVALAAGAFAMSITGSLKISSSAVNAGGPIAVTVGLLLIHFWPQVKGNPGQPVDNPYPVHVEGNLFFGDSPLNNVELRFLTMNHSTRTNAYGQFNVDVTPSDTSRNLSVQLVSPEIKLDTVITVDRQTFASNGARVVIPKKCVTCRQLGTNGQVVNEKTPCSASVMYLRDYCRGFIQAGSEQLRPTTCTWADGTVMEWQPMADQGSGTAALPTHTFYPDVDQDGHGDGSRGQDFHLDAAPTGYVSLRDDCCDQNPEVWNKDMIKVNVKLLKDDHEDGNLDKHDAVGVQVTHMGVELRSSTLYIGTVDCPCADLENIFSSQGGVGKKHLLGSMTEDDGFRRLEVQPIPSCGDLSGATTVRFQFGLQGILMEEVPLRVLVP